MVMFTWLIGTEKQSPAEAERNVIGFAGGVSKKALFTKAFQKASSFCHLLQSPFTKL